MFDESRYRSSAGGGAHKQGWTATQPARVSERSGDDRLVESPGKAQVFVIGISASTLAVVNSLRPTTGGEITVRLIPLAWTPLGIAIGDTRQDVGIPLAGLFDWIDRTFSADDEHAVVASIRDLELLARIGWSAPFPEPLDDRGVLNAEDLPAEIADALARPSVGLVACVACRRLCVRDDFKRKEKELCAWDYHAQVFGRRGPWRESAYEPRHFETIPTCAYVVSDLLAELGVELLLTLGELPDSARHAIVNMVLEQDSGRSHMAVKTAGSIVLLREA